MAHDGGKGAELRNGSSGQRRVEISASYCILIRIRRVLIVRFEELAVAVLLILDPPAILGDVRLPSFYYNWTDTVPYEVLSKFKSNIKRRRKKMAGNTQISTI